MVLQSNKIYSIKLGSKNFYIIEYIKMFYLKSSEGEMKILSSANTRKSAKT
jgi:hypothetical protein